MGEKTSEGPSNCYPQAIPRNPRVRAKGTKGSGCLWFWVFGGSHEEVSNLRAAVAEKSRATVMIPAGHWLSVLCEPESHPLAYLNSGVHTLGSVDPSQTRRVAPGSSITM